eukprot:13586847-Alexandrium_andersonii.AAC.1
MRLRSLRQASTASRQHLAFARNELEGTVLLVVAHDALGRVRISFEAAPHIQKNRVQGGRSETRRVPSDWRFRRERPHRGAATASRTPPDWRLRRERPHRGAATAPPDPPTGASGVS